ncbi:WcaG Nucleoside-diphosphate-sugar epimerases [actinobacterium SCGC AAA044-D11]
MKVLITGGAGFIGSHLAEEYQASGDEVVIIDNLSTGNKNNLSAFNFSGELVEGDIRDISLMDSLIRKSDLVLHMAAALGVANIMSSPLESMSTNITGSEIVLNAAAKYGRRILIASTSEIYGKNPKQPLSEEDDRVIGSPQNIRWSYSDAKAIEEAMARSLNIYEGLPVTTIRFFNTVGPRQTGKYGMVLPRFVKSALGNEDICVYGDGMQSRVFCHVSDAISAVKELINFESSVGEVFNVGGETEITIVDLAEFIIKETNSKSKIVFLPYESVYPIGFEDMQRRVPNTEKIRFATSWAPEKDLKFIINDVTKYLKSIS